MTLTRADIPTLPVLPTQVVPFAPLGGNVTVRGLLLQEQLANGARTATEQTPLDGETAAEAKARAHGTSVLRVVAQTVVDGDGTPLLTQAEWSALSVKHGAEVFDLANIALGLSGSNLGAAEKNS